MYSLILHTAARFLLPMLLLFSLFLLLRGHDEPGGGFVGGLVAAAAFAMHLIAHDAAETRRVLRADPKTLIGAGLALVSLAGIWGLFLPAPFLTAAWGHTELPVVGKLGTPLLFDIGVYFSVLGAILTILLALVED
jgi:multicomponent Na+:H+ antiporter subunit B